jgi:dihydrodiol dehydrogenase / D-xylose 1-dehydrogenase (NADP)
VNAKEAKDLVAYARKKNLFLMEAIWSRHFPAYHKLRDELEKKTIGDVLQVIVPFGIQATPQSYHLKPRETGAGTMNDIGVYCVQVATLVFGLEKPHVISAGHLNDDGVDASTSSTLVYSHGRTATLLTSSYVELANEAVIIGTEGTIKIPFPFWCPNKLETPGETYEFELPKSTLKPILLHSEALSYQCVEARRCIQKGLIESPYLPHEESVLIAEIVEDIRKQVGVEYPADKQLNPDDAQRCYGVAVPLD